MQLFYIPNISGTHITLNESESKHCTRALRLKKGDKVQLIDGVGGLYFAEIEIPDSKKCQLKILDSVHGYNKRNHFLHIAISPTKNIDRFEWFLEKATEIGIDEITPTLCRYSERKVIKPERLKSITISAIKQSLKAYLPTLNGLAKFEELVSQPFDGAKYIAHCYKGNKALLKDMEKKSGKVLILIGPEGDFSEAEVEMAKANGFKEISLGKSRLRTETAGVVACHTVNLLNE